MPWSQFGIGLKDVTCSTARPGEGVIEYTQQPGTDGQSTQHCLASISVHVFNEAEVAWAVERHRQRESVAAAGGHEQQASAEANPCTLPADEQRPRVAKLSQRSEQRLVQTAVHLALQDLKARSQGLFGTNKAETRLSAAVPVLASSLSSIILSATSHLLPFACNLLSCDPEHLRARLQCLISESAAKELQHTGPTCTDVNPAAGRQQAAWRARNQGEEPEQLLFEDPEEDPCLGSYEASTQQASQAPQDPHTSDSWQPGPSTIFCAPHTQQNNTPSMLPLSQTQPLKRARTHPPALEHTMQEGSPPTQTTTYQQSGDAMVSSQDECARMLAEGSPGRHALQPEQSEGSVGSVPEGLALQSPAHHSQHGGLLQLAQCLYNVRPVKKAAWGQQLNADEDWLL